MINTSRSDFFKLSVVCNNERELQLVRSYLFLT